MPRYKWALRSVIALFVAIAVFGARQTHSTQAAEDPPRTVIVHLFEWKWPDVARECETFLGPNGFAAVQVSPPHEHLHIAEAGYPWWERYQVVSYDIESRSGTRAEFADMVNRCHAAGVQIYVDAVINHMTGYEGNAVSFNGSSWSQYEYPGTYAPWDFHYCGTSGHEIYSYSDRYQVQNCELLNLADLNTGSSYVQGRIAAYLNDLISLGVDGFRIDAAKHIDASEIQAIVGQLNGNPYIYQEVIESDTEPVKAYEYFGSGDVTEFKYSTEIGRVFDSGQLAWLGNFGPSWGMMDSSNAVAFVDNHDNQRGHGGGGHIVTHQQGDLYALANVYMLAWPYGYTRVMSSYQFSNGDQGPPSVNGVTNSIYSSPTDTTPDCFGAWVCEHRWQAIAGMVGFRNHTAHNWYTTDWWTNGNNQIAFGRGDAGFVVINREGYGLNRTFQTSMPAGTYCNVTDGGLNAAGDGCTGGSVTVGAGGTASIAVGAMASVAIHEGAKVSDGGEGTATVTFGVDTTTYWGQNVYVVGSVPELGSWNTAQAVPLAADNYPLWSAAVVLPGNTTITYKYVKIDGGNVEWLPGANLQVTTPDSGGSITLSDAW